VRRGQEDPPGDAPGGTGDAARRYHDGTKHSPRSVRRGGHALDWQNQPHPFKEYEEGDATTLPPPDRSGVPAVAAIAAQEPIDGSGLDVPGVSRLLAYGAGVHRTWRLRGGDTMHLRTYASAGALYPVELYVAATDLPGSPGLHSGLYHFDPLQFRLTLLRDTDPRPWVVRASGGAPGVSAAPVTLALTGIPWRTAWKYGERGYRHLFWDAGMILANLLALAAAGGLPASVVLGFADGEMETVIGLDGIREFALCLVTVGAGDPAPESTRPPARISPRVRPLSRREPTFEGIGRANDAGRLDGPNGVRAWVRGRPSPNRTGRSPGTDGSGGPETARLSTTTSSFRVGPAGSPVDGLEAVIRRRGSARMFGPGAIPAPVLGSILEASTRGLPTDLPPAALRLTVPYLVANAVEGLAPGAYRYRDGAFEMLREGDFRRQAGYLCLEQRLGADAAATMFLMTDLDDVLDRWGDRGYRLAQLEAGVVAGRLYLGAYAHRFGATGLTFYDDEVTSFFSPQAAGTECMLVVAIGESPRLARRRGVI
jgi:SagB-type dehydrogenase family enzyme